MGRLEDLIEKILIAIGEDPMRPGLRDTPKAAAALLRQVTSEQEEWAEEIPGSARPAGGETTVVAMTDLEVASLCEHHLLPFFGTCSVAYVPADRILTPEALADLVRRSSRRLQVQERLTNQIADALDRALRPRGAAVMVETQHLCMLMRGIQKANSRIVTTAFRGAPQGDAASRAALFQALRLRRGGRPGRGDP